MSPAARNVLTILALSVVVIGGGAAVLGIAWWVKGRETNEGVRDERPSRVEEQSEKWDKRALADYLKANGFPKLKMINHEHSTWFATGFDQDYYGKGRNISLDEAIDQFKFIGIREGFVKVIECGTIHGARTFIRGLGDDEVHRYWPWGKFVFVGNLPDFDLLKKALK